MAPFSAASGSVVGFPSASMAHLRQRLALPAMKLDIASGDRAGRKVEDKWRSARTRPGERQGIRSEYRFGSAGRGHPRVAGRHGHCDQSFARQRFHFGPERGEVKAAIDGHGRQTAFPGFPDEMRQAGLKRQQRVTKAGIDPDDRFRLIDDFRHRVTIHLPVANGMNADQQAIQAMRLALVALARDDHVCDRLAVRLGVAVRLQNVERKLAYLRERELDGFRH
jgi:hypothetical protein